MKYKKMKIFSLRLILFLAFFPSLCSGELLKSPWDASHRLTQKETLHAANSITCPRIKFVDKDLNANFFYKKNGYGDTPDPKDLDKLHKRVKNLKASIKTVVDLSEKYKATKNDGFAACGAASLLNLANNGSMLGNMQSIQSEFELTWALSSYSISWLKIRGSKLISHHDRYVIMSWLNRLGEKNINFWRKRKDTSGNILYSHGLSSAAVGISLNNIEKLKIGRKILIQAIDNINSDGYIVPEINRGHLSLAYLNLDASILVVLNQLLEENNIFLDNPHRAKFDFFIKTLLNALKNPKNVEAYTGKSQNIPSGIYTGWILSYYSGELPPNAVNVLNKYKGKDFYKIGGG